MLCDFAHVYCSNQQDAQQEVARPLSRLCWVSWLSCVAKTEGSDLPPQISGGGQRTQMARGVINGAKGRVPRDPSPEGSDRTPSPRSPSPLRYGIFRSGGKKSHQMVEADQSPGTAPTMHRRISALYPMSIKSKDKGSNGLKKGRSQNNGVSSKGFSPHAVGLGFRHSERWADFTDPKFFPMSSTDRTHGMIGRTPNESIPSTANAPKQMAPKQMEKRSEKPMVGGDDKKVVRGKYGAYQPAPNLELGQDVRPPAAPSDLPDFSGRWLCQSTEGPWEVYLRLAGVSEIQIKLSRGTRYGVSTTRSAMLHLAPRRLTQSLDPDLQQRRSPAALE